MIEPPAPDELVLPVPDAERPIERTARPSPEEARAFKEAWQSRPAFEAPTETVGAELPAPVYTSWEDYLARTTERKRLEWCRVKAKTANRERRMSGRPERSITPQEVWQVAETAQGRCTYCGSLALEGRPTGHDGRPMPWAMVGRRIGSLDHRLAIVDGGTNDWENLAWACLWCNVWTAETDRQPGATDHGALQDCPSDEPKREHPLKREVTYAWNLRDVMRSKGMYVTTDLGPHLADRGFDLSEGQVRRLVSQAPERLSLTLLAALCDIFRCTPADLITIESPSSPPARPLTWRKWST